MLPLVLPHGELRRGSTVDHIAVVDGREALVFFVSLFVVDLIFPLVVFLQPQAVEVFFSACCSLRACDLLLPCDRGRALLASCRRWPPLGVLEAFASCGGDEIIVEGLALERSHFVSSSYSF